MIEEIHNGYRITGNHAATGREYHVCGADGTVLAKCDGRRKAVENAVGREPGGVEAPSTETVNEPTQELAADSETTGNKRSRKV